MRQGIIRTLINCFVIFALLADSSIIQLTAWATMIPTRIIERGSVAEAVESTFSGKAPCPLCLIAEKKTQKDPESPARVPSDSLKKLSLKTLPEELKSEWQVVIISSIVSMVEWRNAAPDRSYAPEVPPPRGLLFV